MDALSELEQALAGSRLITDPELMDAHRRDEASSVVPPGEPLAVVLAESTEDVAACLRWASAHRIPVVPRGGGSGLAGGASAIDGCLVLSTARMNRIKEISPDDQLAVVEPGVINADLDRAAAELGLMYAPDPSSHEICTIGGNVGTNAGGLRCVKYGVTRDSVLALQVVLADGRVINTGHRTVKGVTGYDLTALFVGSEGTLGVVTEVTVRLRPRPIDPVTVVGSFPSLRAAGEAVAAVVRAGLTPSLMELIDRATLRAIDDLTQMGLGDTEAMLIAQCDDAGAERFKTEVGALFTEHGADFVAQSDTPEESAQLLEVRRLSYPAMERLGTCLVEDVGVPRSRLADLLQLIDDTAAKHDVRILTVAHAGDGNTHPTFVFEPLPDGSVPEPIWAAADEIFRGALEMGGTLTGEHGVGVLKQRWLGLELGDDVMAVNAAIKAALDPLTLMNPGRGI